MPDITYDVGRVSFIMKGAWNLATNYEKLDAVTHDGSLYIAKQDVPGGTAITNTTYWQLAAEKGDKGDTGGVDSVNGQQGDIWFPDSRQLISDGYTTDTAPFLMKGNDSDSDRFELAKKLGNTVAVNQLVPDDKRSKTFSVSPTETYTFYLGQLVAGHQYLVFRRQKTTLTSAERNTFCYNDGTAHYQSGFAGNQLAAGVYFWVFSPSNTTTGNVSFWVADANTDVEDTDFTLIDLTLWFGSNDRIPADLLAHPENWGDYYAGSLDYNAGALESADGTVLTSFGTDGVTVLTEVDTGSEPLYGDGTPEHSDGKTPDGAITRRRARVDMGTLVYYKYPGEGYGTLFYTDSLIGQIKHASDDEIYTISSKFVSYPNTYQEPDSSPYFLPDGALRVRTSDGRLYIHAEAYSALDGGQFGAAMSGIYLEYDRATPTTEQGTAFEPLVATVKNGVLSWTQTKGIPVGQESHWFENLRKRVEDRLPDPPSGDGTYRLTCTISGGVKTYSWEA